MCNQAFVAPCLVALLVGAGFPVVTHADEQREREFFETRIRPILVERCYQCHSQRSDPPKGKLRLDSPAGWRRGGESGPAIVAGKPGDSLLISALEYDAFKMPPDGRLPASVVKDFRTWIEWGVPVPETFGAAVSAAATQSSIDWATARQFWSFRPLVDDDLPAGAVAGEGNGIDHYLALRRAEAGVTAPSLATRRQLIRRLAFGLLGLPPTRQQIEEFLADRQPHAYQRLIGRLLASPQYGEHWGRHWLDVVRYADSNGADENKPYPLAYHYRNYVIDAFNQDRPFDEFVREQIAGDLLPDGGNLSVRNRRITATAFLALGIKIAAEQDQEKKRSDIIDEQIDVIGRAMLGLTIACARCHDHKFDPIPTADYYALAGVLRSTKLETRSLVDPRQAALNVALADAQKRLDVVRTAAETRISKAGRKSITDYLLQSRAVARWRRTAQSSRLRAALSRELASPYLSVGGLVSPETLGATGEVREAEEFDRGNVQSDHESYGKGIGIISDAGPGGTVWVEYDVDVPVAATYQIEFRYAAKSSRPGKLLVNGQEVNARSMANTTGSWTPETQRWFVEGRFPFRAGANVLRFEVVGVMSHLDRWLLARVDPAPLPAQESESFARGNVQPFESGETTFISDPPTNQERYFVEYDLATEVRGLHTLLVRYAAAEPRPMTLSIDGNILSDKAVGGVTGGWSGSHQRWHVEANFDLAPGSHILRLERVGAVCHMDQWALLRPSVEIREVADPQTLAHRHGLDRGALAQWTDFLQTAAVSDPLFSLWNWIGNDKLRWPDRIARWRDTTRPAMKLAERMSFPADASDRVVAARMAAAIKEVLADESGEDWMANVASLLEGPQGPWEKRRHPPSHYATNEREATGEIEQQVTALETAISALPKVQVMAAAEADTVDQPIYIRGNHLQHGPRVPRRFLSVLEGVAQASYPADQSGRLQLANSIADRRNPVTARVIANRVWRWHFGRALVDSTENFGHSGELPTHPRLLDHLASKLIEFKWSLKSLQRYIVTSRAYRMASTYDAKDAERDPANVWYWRYEPQRLPAESIRDTLLYVAGRLELTAGGGALAGVKSQDPSPADLRNNRQLYEANGRRSIYLPIVRTNVYKLFTLFDFPNPAAPTGNRSTTTIPTQALFLMNNPWVQGIADAIAEQVCGDERKPALRCRVLFERLYGRLPSDAELEESLSLVAQVLDDAAAPADPLTGWKTLTHTLLLSSEFIYVH